MTIRSLKAPKVPAHPLVDIDSDEVGFDGRFALQIVKFRYRKFDGAWSRQLTWELWRRGNAVVILPYDPWTDRVALIEQFRLPALSAGLDPVMTECPAGLLETGEDPVVAAARETLEETGLVADRVLDLGGFMLMQGSCDEIARFSLARVRLPEPGILADAGLETEGESTRVVVLPALEAFAMVADNRVLNAPTALALLSLQVRRAALRDEWRA
ncbi:NUDIX domain-containing protein [Humitalea rosea]|uniref:NUDIX domain-containing protein n=1 Tax=Humitalea rosea TaxID=990373 RepID=UPI000DAC0865|nr:NUDIX domain-containing protein [Humitalea rosea]